MLQEKPRKDLILSMRDMKKHKKRKKKKRKSFPMMKKILGIFKHLILRAGRFF